MPSSPRRSARNHPTSVLRRWPSALSLTATVVATTACGSGILDPRGPVGTAERTILIDALVIMLAIVVPTIVGTLATAWWFRGSNAKARHTPTWAFSGRIELVVWSIPLMVILLLGGVTWIGAHALDPAKPLASKAPALDIQVVSLDWKWLFIYPGQQVAAVNELVVPAGVPLHLTLTSASVMNAFFIPQLGSMIYTMNGMATQLYLQADVPGTYRGQSSHYSGDGFSDMHFGARAVSADAFAAWVQSARTAGPTLTAATYGDLTRQSVAVAPGTYRAVEAGLFDRIVAQALPPGPGPASDRAGATDAAKQAEH